MTRLNPPEASLWATIFARLVGNAPERAASGRIRRGAMGEFGRKDGVGENERKIARAGKEKKGNGFILLLRRPGDL